MLVHLPVVRFEQKPGRCGAATAQMILHYKNRIGNLPADQDALWAAIQSSTGGSRPASPPASIAAHDCPQWTTQQCDKCLGAQEFRCWCTFPPALLSVLLSHNLPFALQLPATNIDGTASVIASVDFDIPAAALVKFGLHWVVVAGYETDGVNARMVNGKAISEMYIRDPEVGAANHDVTIDTWLDEYLAPVIQCGTYLSKLVVASATGPAPVQQPGPVPAAPSNVRIRRKHKKKPKRPVNPRAIVARERSRRR